LGDRITSIDFPSDGSAIAQPNYHDRWNEVSNQACK